MQADSFRIAKVFSNGGDTHFRLPYFQREYAWKTENWQTLWNDIDDLYLLYKDEQPPEHFMGSLVVINEGTLHGTIPAFKVVDGQQRLTTISLIICALADLIKDEDLALHNRIRKYITNPDETGDLYFKLLPTSKSGDRTTYFDLIHGKPIGNSNSQIYPAYQFYRDEIAKKLESGEMEPDKLFLVVINSLQVVFINLNDNERPYQIFESLNAKGKPLTQADLVRNYIAMKLPESRQPVIFEQHWSKIEDLLQEKRPVGKSRLGELTAFLRHYLAYRNGVLCNEEHVYARFRDRIQAEFTTAELFETEVITLQQFASYYDHMLRPENDPDASIRKALQRLNLLEFSTGYPFLLGLFDAFGTSQINRDELLEGMQVLENYMMRRYLAGEKTNYLNKVFPSLWSDVNPKEFIPTLKRSLLQRQYPSDHRIRQAAYTQKLYENRQATRQKVTMLLESINLHLSRKINSGAVTVLDGEPTIEHVMPQTLDEAWQAELGENYEQIHEQYLNTLGNLTLVTAEWNSSLSNSAFKFKKEKLAHHGLLLNQSYFWRDLSHWNEETIKQRADRLVQSILELWPALGEQQTTQKAVGTKPVRLTFLDQDFPVSTWRDVAEQTTEAVIGMVDEFDTVARTLPAYLDMEPFSNASRKLSNGWYMNVNLSAHALKTYCRLLISRLGLSVDDWRIEEE